MVKQEVKSIRPGSAGGSLISQKISFFYSVVFINAMRFFFFVVSLFNEKTRRGLRGRRFIFDNLKKNLSRIPADKRIWFHASSLGEFEQAKPIIEILKQSGYNIIVSFFSPSGYEHSLNYSSADVITYIPLDSPKNAHKFVQLVKPNVVVVMRYDLWLNHLIAAKEFGAKIIIADATFSMKLFNRAEFLRNFYRQLYRLADSILATTSEHKKMFDFFLGNEITNVGGDTRFDRVYSKSVSNNVAQKIPITFEKSNKVVMV
ncbi:MAG: glycosyltransferase N-terminal domain-containing protein, partial [Candidatus Kryptoniota bacterium]